MGWFSKHLPGKIGFGKSRLWKKCDACGHTIYLGELSESHGVCTKCDHHFVMSHEDRLGLMIDRGTFEEFHSEMRSGDPLGFSDSQGYVQRLEAAVSKTRRFSAFVFGRGRISGFDVIFGNLDFAFMGGSMGSVVGEKFTIAAETARFWKIPFVTCVGSGGARMQEGILSLMQMAKTSAALAALSEAGIPYVSILTHPTTGGVTASFAMLGDVVIAEPGALVGFAGPRVIEQTIRQPLPEGFQTAEFNLEHGFVDMVVHRRDLKPMVARLLDFFMDGRREI